MYKRKFLIFMVFVLAAAALCWGVDKAAAQTDNQLRRQQALDSYDKLIEQRHAIDPNFPPKLPEFQATPQPAPLAGQVGFNPFVQYNVPNYANSPNLRKFVDKLPGLGVGNANNLGQYIPVATADAATYPGSQYYELSVNEYAVQMHSDLPGPCTTTLAGVTTCGGATLPTTILRGYRQLNNPGGLADTSIHYLGPVIIAKSFDPRKAPGVGGNGWPVRLKIVNNLPRQGAPGAFGLAGQLPIPVDTTVMGAGTGPLNPFELYTQNRVTTHLHGGFTPWISDGTPHQWKVPAGETIASTSYPKGASFQNVPDMIAGVGCAATGNPAACVTPNDYDGTSTLYYTNQQSSRLMFYHDHAYGITRLNVYAGIAAGYLLYDQVEEDLITGTNVSGVFNGTALAGTKILPDMTTGATWTATGGVYKYGIPLIIQDKTFVNGPGIAAIPGFAGTPTDATLNVDPLWSWGNCDALTSPANCGGQLWFPHEYMPNENIYDPSGFLAMGRWDYGPWMNPPALVNNNILPSPTIVPEAFMDTMVVNGTAFPTVTLPPQAVRFRILSVGNDRMLNLQLYKAATAAGTVCNGVPAPMTCTEVNMVPAAPPAIPCNPASPPDPKTGLPTLPANCTPTTWPTDGRDGGVPDPTTAGPQFYVIANEGGFLPQVAPRSMQPVRYEYFRRLPTVLGTNAATLMLGPAERSDVIVDFSGYPAGTAFILYNDAPAPNPLYDTRYDYYTGDPDQRSSGGAPSTPAGFGPNTRTIMQIVIGGTPSATPFSAANLTTMLPKAYRTSQDPPIMPESAYNAAFNTAYVDVYPNNVAESLNTSGVGQAVSKVVTTLPGIGYTSAPNILFIGGFPPGCTAPACTDAVATACLNGVTAITVTAAGSNYINPPAVTIAAPPAGPGARTATAIATIQGGVINAITITDPGCGYDPLGLTAPLVTIAAPPAPGTLPGAVASLVPGSVGTITLNSGGSGYTSAPQVFVTGGMGQGATAAARLAGDILMDTVAITEGFDIMYGRMNVQLGTLPNPLNPTAPAPAVPGIAAYIDPPSDFTSTGKPSVWRVTHLGVDSHAVHLHLVNFQVINRVDWTNDLLPPDPYELGWKETFRTIPFTDAFIAFKPKAMVLPFQLPHSIRLLDVTQPQGSTVNFVKVVPGPGAPAAAGVTNVMTDFGFEYVWHCHLLGHEEGDMMRPLVLSPYVIPGVAHVPAGVGIYNPSNRMFSLNAIPTNLVFAYGAIGDKPIVGDWNGDGVTTIGVYRPSDTTFRLRNTNNSGLADYAAFTITGGLSTDIPIAGNWTNSPTGAGVGLFTPSTRTFKLKNTKASGAPDFSFVFDPVPAAANADLVPLAGDWDGNGTTTVGLFQLSTRTFYLRNTNSAGAANVTFAFGAVGDFPVVADWNGDATVTAGVYRSSMPGFLEKNSNAGGVADAIVVFGAPGVIPIAGIWK